ncbi:MAG: MFS transporter, partial [Spirochaetales bacterium]
MGENGSGKQFEVSKGYAYYVFVLLFILYMLDFTDRYVIASLFPHIKADWGLSDTECALLMSTVTWAVMVLTLPISVLVDRWSRKKSIGIMAVLWSLACAACAFTKNFGQLFVARTALGVGEAGYVP